MTSALRAGLAYFALVFTIGFLLGTFRVLVVIPRLGDTGAVLLELPVMLALSWFACVWLTRRFAVPPAVRERLVMGGVAFALLMLGEIGVTIFGFGRTVAEHFAGYQAMGAQLGLAAQVCFALMPFADAAVRSATTP